MLFKSAVLVSCALISLASAQIETVPTAGALPTTLLIDTSAITKPTQAPVPAPAAPAPPPPPAPACNCWVKHPDNYGDVFNISGKGLDPVKLGAWGEGLLGQLRHCGGTVTKWTFFWGDGKGGGDLTTWTAQGWTVVWQKHCIGNSALTVGCPSNLPGNCLQNGE